MTCLYAGTGSISGTVTIGYPGWVQFTIPVGWQLREPGLPPTAPVASGTIILDGGIEIGQRAIAFDVGPLLDGTYDFAMKHRNHLSDMETNVIIAGSDVTGIDFTLWAGDSDGDDNPNDPSMPPPIGENGDDDVDFYDYFTFYYQYLGSIPITSAEGDDFDGDGDVDFYDYYGLYYGWMNCPRPPQWAYFSDIIGDVTFKFPGWTQEHARVTHRIRESGIPPENSDTCYGFVDMQMSGDTGSFVVYAVSDGTFDITVKHRNHLSETESAVIVSGGDVTGLEYSLWAGDADGDDNEFSIFPDDAEGDDDFDPWDSYTIYYQYIGALPAIVSGYNGDFDGDGDVDIDDYNGCPWHYPPPD